MRAAKWILIVVGALVALLAAGALYVTQVVDANRYKPEIQQAVLEATGRELQLEGDIELSVFPWVALEMGAGSLGNPQGFTSPALVTWREARVAARLWPLLRDRLVIDRIRISGAKLTLTRLADGRANWDGWGESAADEAVGTNNSPDIAGFTLSDSTLEYSDAATGDRVSLEDWRLETSAIRGAEPVEIETAFVARRLAAAAATADGPNAALEISLRYTAAAERTLVEQLALTGRLNGLAAEPTELQLAVPRLEITQGTALAVTDWTATVGALEASGNVSGTLMGAVALSGAVHARGASLRKALAGVGSTAPATRDPAAFGPFDLQMQWDYGAAGLTTRAFALSLDDTRLSGSLGLGPAAPRQIDFTLAGDRIDLDRYLEPEDAVSEPFIFPTATLKALPARGVLEFATATLAGAELEKVRVRLILDEAGARSDTAKPP
jgi:AsmA protein